MAVVVFVLDQASKLAVEATLPLPVYAPDPAAPEIIPGFLYLAHVGNTGAAWGLFDGMRWPLALLAVAALVAIYAFREGLEIRLRPQQLIFGLFAGGIAGNLFDRLFRAYVVDFIDVHLPGYRWPAFNLADSALTIGVILYFALTLWESRRKPSASPGARTPLL